MGITIFPVRAPIGKARTEDGRSLDVLMTPEFSRALSDILARIGGTDGVSTTELARMIKLLQQQAVTLVEQVKDLFELAQTLSDTLEDQALLQATAPERQDVGAMLDDAAALALAGAPGADNRGDELADLMALALMQDQALRIQKNTVTGSRGGNVALASLLTALAKSGIITDSTT